jgi:hypothetical protein
MTCDDCQYLGDKCGGIEGDPGFHTMDPRALSKKELVQLACTIVRAGSLICDIAGVQASGQPLRGPFDVTPQPYIWDTEED